MRRLMCCLMMIPFISASTIAVAALSVAPAATPATIPVTTEQSAIQPPAPAKATKKSRKQKKVEAEKDIIDYQRAISNIESQEGVYGGQLTEKLSSLGAALQYNGEHDKAIKIFKRGIHISRINDGLYTTGQVDMLERLIASHMALGQWKEVSERYHYLYWLNKQNYGSDDPRMLPALNQLSRWHLQAYGMQFGKDRDTVTKHLISAHTFIEKSIDLLERTKTSESRLVEELNGLTLTNYLFATFQRPIPNSLEAQRPADPEVRHSAMMIDQYINRSFRAGKDAISRVIDIYEKSEEAPPWAVAKAKVKLADWLLMFNKRHAAFKLYQEAYRLMTNEKRSHNELKRTFDQPVALPNLDIMDTNNYSAAEQSGYDAEKNYVLASFDVTAQGKAANIQIIESKPVDNISARSQVKKSLRVAKFRPRFVAGEPALTEKMQLKVLSH